MDGSPHVAAMEEAIQNLFGPSTLHRLQVESIVVHSFRVDTRDTSYFVKFPASPSQEAAANALLSVELNCPVLLEHGVTSTKQPYLVYEWMDLETFDPSQSRIAAAGELVGLLHQTTRGATHPGLQLKGPINEEIETQVRSISRLEPELAGRLTGLLSGLGALCEVVDSHFPKVLVHGDFAWQNVGIDRQGRVVLFDFESGSIASPLRELMRSWHGDLRDDADRAAFLDGYCGVTGADRTVMYEGAMPLELLRAVRFLLAGLVAHHEGTVKSSVLAIEELRADLARRGALM